MERVSFDDLDPTGFQDGTRRHGLAEPLGTAHVAVNRYRVPPGAGFPGGLHAHLDQEEVFVVLEGTATFETLDGEVTVGADETVRFAPGEYQSGRNGGDTALVALAIGAPLDSGDIRLPLACPACGFVGLRLETGGELVFACPDCETEHAPAPCPACGHDELRATLDDDGEVVVACQGCGAEYPEPPLVD